MKHMIGVVSALVLVVLAGGCSDKYESAMKDQLSYLKEMNNVLSDVKDKESLKTARLKLEGLGKKMADLAKKIEEMGEPPEKRQKELAEKYGKELEKTMQELVANMMRLASIGGGAGLGKMFDDIDKLQ